MRVEERAYSPAFKEQRELFELHARLGKFTRKVERTQKIIQEALNKASNPYIAFSNGIPFR